MDCRQAVALMAQEPAGTLAGADHAALEAHVEGCVACQAEREAQGRVWAALGEGGEDDPFERDPTFAAAGSALAPAFTAQVIPRLHAAVAQAQRRRRARRWRVMVGAASGALALAAGIAIVAGAGRRLEVPAPVPTVQPTTPSMAAVPAPATLPEPLAAFVANAPGSDMSRRQAIALVGPHFGDRQSPAPSELIAALTRTLRTDRNPGVRKKAAQALLGLAPTPEIRAAFMLALRKDSNPAIRIIAMAAGRRAARDFDPASIETLRERADDQGESRNLRNRAARALQTLAL
jgi:hypothetical protein